MRAWLVVNFTLIREFCSSIKVLFPYASRASCLQRPSLPSIPWSMEQTELKCMLMLFALFNNWKTCFSPFFTGNLYPIQRDKHTPTSIPFTISKLFCCPLANKKLSILFDHQVWERSTWTCITYNSFLGKTIDFDVNKHSKKGVTSSFSSSLQSSRQLEQTHLPLSTLSLNNLLNNGRIIKIIKVLESAQTVEWNGTNSFHATP